MTFGAITPRDAGSEADGAVALLVLVQNATGGAGSAAGRFAEAFLVGDESVPVDVLASRSGFGNRHRMRRALVREGFKGPVQLSGLLQIARWLWRVEVARRSLAAQCLTAGRDPAVAYRSVQARTGMTWTALRRRGSVWFVDEFLRSVSHAATRQASDSVHNRAASSG